MESIIACFFKDTNINKIIVENFKKYELCVESRSINIPSETLLYDTLSLFPSRDEVIIDIIMDHNDPISLNSKSNNISEFLQQINDLNSIRDQDSIFILKSVINKGIDNQNMISIYSLEHLSLFLSNECLSNLLHCFKSVLDNSKSTVYFELQKDDDYFFSSSIAFISKSDNHYNHICFKEKLLQKRDEISHFLNASYYKFTPDDFYLLKRSKNKDINLIMDRLAILFSIIFLSNITNLDNSKIDCRIDGYKAIKQNFEFNEINPDFCKEYYKIYKWVYEGGNLNDKIGLARNIISLHIKNGNILDLEDNTLSSIRSSHELYLRQNIQQYIEVKNKVVEFLSEMSQKTSEIIDSFVDSLKNNITGFISFFLSIIVLNVISNGEQRIFTKEIALVSFGFLGMSFLFLIFSIIETNKKKARFNENYKKLKSRYIDIFDEEDLNRIFNSDKDHEKDLEYIKGQTILFSILWFLSIIILFSIVLFMSDYGSQLTNRLKIILPHKETKVINIIKKSENILPSSNPKQEKND